MYRLFFLFLCTTLLEASLDAEKATEMLEELWSSIPDIHSPSLEDYRRIDAHLKERRHYLLFPSDPVYQTRANTIFDFQLLGPNDEMPVTEIYSLNPTEKTKDRCILLYASRNKGYLEKAKTLLTELEEIGYSGDLIIQTGGFPNTENGGLKLCHVPYAFKAAFLKQAEQMGYRHILWLDLAIHPLFSVEPFFHEIEKTGYFFSHVGSLQENEPSHLKDAALSMGITPTDYGQIPHLSSSILGINTANPKSLDLLNQWLEEIEKIAPCISWFPEELSLSVVADRLDLRSRFSFGSIVCTEAERFWLPIHKETIQAYLDARR